MIALAVGTWTAGPTWRAIKGFRARQMAAEALALLRADQPMEAARRAAEALQISPREPAAHRALGKALLRIDRPGDALQILRALQSQGRPPELDDLRDLAAAALGSRELPSARTTLSQLQERVSLTPSDRLLLAEEARQSGDVARMLTEARRVLAETPPDHSELRAKAVELLFASRDPLAGDEALALAAPLAAEPSLAGLRAALAQAAYFHAQPEAFTEPTISAAEAAAQRLADHPRAKWEHRLVAQELRIRLRPGQKEPLILAITLKASAESQDVQAQVARWALQMGSADAAERLVPALSAVRAPSMFLTFLELRAKRGKWEEIRTVLEAERFPIELRLKHVLLARAAGHLGDPTAGLNHWKRAFETCDGNGRCLAELAWAARDDGAIEAARRGFALAAEAGPRDRDIQDLALVFTARNGRAAEVLERLRAMLEQWPTDRNLLADEAYYSLLAGDAIARASATVERLAAADAWSPSIRAAHALSHLRRGRPAEALALFRERPLDTDARPGARAVYAAALRANGFEVEAREEAGRVNQRDLCPEERALLGEPLTSPAP